MKPSLGSNTFLKGDYIPVEKAYHPDQRLFFRIYLCICVFVGCILVLLHCSSMDHSAVHKAKVVFLSENAKLNNPIKDSKFLCTKGLTALYGLGTIFVRGNMAMDELVVAHVAEDTYMEELKLFLRTFYRSGLAARVDLVLLFTSSVLPEAMKNTIRTEFEHCCKLISQVKENKTPITQSENPIYGAFDPAMYAKLLPHRTSIWGHHLQNSWKSDKRTEVDDTLVFGSVVGFSLTELDVENRFDGFIDSPPSELRRWACYQLLLGMVKSEFKHVLLTGVSGVAFISDPLAMARAKIGLYLSLEDVNWASVSSRSVGVDGEAELGLFKAMKEFNQTEFGGLNDSKHRHVRRLTMVSRTPVIKSYVAKALKQSHVHKRVRRMKRRPKTKGHGDGGLYEQVYGRVMWSALDDAERNKKLVNSAAIVGDIWHVRNLADAMATEIVRVAMHRKSREAFPDSVLLSHLVHKSSGGVLGKRAASGELQLLDNSESFVHSLAGSQQPSLFFEKRSGRPYSMINDGYGKTRLWNHVTDLIHRNICLSSSLANIYDDCLQ